MQAFQERAERHLKALIADKQALAEEVAQLKGGAMTADGDLTWDV